MPNDPSQTSSDYNAMEREWQLISAIMAGVVEMRRHGGEHLPKYEGESSEEYRRRMHSAPWRPEFADILQTLASKPFGRDVAIKGVAPDSIVGELDEASGMRVGGLVDDIDGRGSSLTTFAREVFLKAIAKGAHAILVDYSATEVLRSVKEQNESGARPYWVQVPVDNILALYTETIKGREEIVHVRIAESTVERDGFGEKTTRRVRVLEPGLCQVYEQQPNGSWLLVEEYFPIRNGKHTSVPLVLFFTGERVASLRVRPPLGDLAQLQVELWKALSRQEEILTYAGAPMLAANGLAAPKQGERIEVGPKTVLFAPPVGDGVKTGFEYVQPAAANIREIREHVTSIQADMRRIGMQPLTEQPGNPSATGQSIAAAKAHSQVKAWALLLNDAIEQALRLHGGIPRHPRHDPDGSVDRLLRHPLRAIPVAGPHHGAREPGHQPQGLLGQPDTVRRAGGRLRSERRRRAAQGRGRSAAYHRQHYARRRASSATPGRSTARGSQGALR